MIKEYLDSNLKSKIFTNGKDFSKKEFEEDLQFPPENKKIENNFVKSSIKKEFKVKEKAIHNNIGISEILRVIKEEENFPVTLSKRIPLKTIVYYYNKLWNNEFTDSSLESDSD